MELANTYLHTPEFRESVKDDTKYDVQTDSGDDDPEADVEDHQYGLIVKCQVSPMRLHELESKHDI